MTNIIEEKVAEVKESLTENPAEVAKLERMANPRVSDMIRLGADHSDQAYQWCSEEGGLCALSAGVVGAMATGWIEKE